MAKKNLFRIIGMLILLLACNLPGGATPTPTESVDNVDALVAGTITALASNGQTEPPAASSIETPTATSSSSSAPATATACITPTVTANVNANVRNGPGTVYNQVGALLLGQTATVAGRNADGTWWYINHSGAPGGFGWIAGSTVTATCIPASLAIIAAPPTPTPVPASGTCKDGYTWRLINSSDKVCVTPASKAQSDADNAAANSRKSVVVYGATACKEGFVWREAYAGDVVCVTPAVRSQAAADNAAAAGRIDPLGAYGPNSCVAGYVWREANAADLVCVEPAVRTQTAADNAAAASRVAGPDDCISGYIWREAFSGDKVCVTSAVKAQVAADNAAAPSHTNP